MTPNQKFWNDLIKLFKKHNKKICIVCIAAITLRVVAKMIEVSDKK